MLYAVYGNKFKMNFGVLWNKYNRDDSYSFMFAFLVAEAYQN